MMEGTPITSTRGIIVLAMYIWMLFAIWVWGDGTSDGVAKSAETPDEDPRDG